MQRRRIRNTFFAQTNGIKSTDVRPKTRWASNVSYSRVVSYFLRFLRRYCALLAMGKDYAFAKRFHSRKRAN